MPCVKPVRSCAANAAAIKISPRERDGLSRFASCLSRTGPGGDEVQPGLTIVTIPRAWYVTTELTGPADRGSQPAGMWTGLAGAELELNPGGHVNSSVLEYLVDRF